MKRAKCGKYKRFELMKISAEVFWKHAEECAECRTNAEQDEKIMAAARKLGRKETLESPGLWNRIEKDLTGFPPSRSYNRTRILRPAFLAPLAAALFMTLGTGLYLALKPNRPNISSGLLAQAALVKVEKAEAEYIKAIEDLAGKTLPGMEAMDLELQFLYKDRLAAVDAQIERCREALGTNPANAHIRRYLMAALQDKKDTLAELLKAEKIPAGNAATKKTI